MKLAAVADILHAVMRETGVPVAEIVGPGRRPIDATLARDGAVWLLHEGRGMTLAEIAAALGVSYRSVAPVYERLKRDPDTRGGRLVARRAALALAESGLDAWLDAPSVERVAEMVAAHTHEPVAALLRATPSGRSWTVGRKALALALADARRMGQHRVADAMGVQRSSIAELQRRMAERPNESDLRAQTLARAAVHALRVEAVNHARAAGAAGVAA